MTRTCTICTHPERAKIESALVSGTPYRVIANQFGVGNNSVQRHADEHVKAEIAEHKEARDEAQALDVVGQLRLINLHTRSILNDARVSGNPELALKAIAQVQKHIELQAKLLGDLDERPQINLALSLDWVAFRTLLLHALAPYPEAKEAAARALLAADAAQQNGNGGAPYVDSR